MVEGATVVSALFRNRLLVIKYLRDKLRHVVRIPSSHIVHLSLPQIRFPRAWGLSFKEYVWLISTPFQGLFNNVPQVPRASPWAGNGSPLWGYKT